MAIFRIQHCQFSCLKIEWRYFTLWRNAKADILFNVIGLSNRHSPGRDPAYDLLARYDILNINILSMVFKSGDVRHDCLIPLNKGKQMLSIYIYPAVSQTMNIRPLQKINCLFEIG